MDYQPLPEGLTIKESPIHGLGLFATREIGASEMLGITHYVFDGTVVRTPLGGFYNHSETPNCDRVNLGSMVYGLQSIRPIMIGDELTAFYRGFRL